MSLDGDLLDIISSAPDASDLLGSSTAPDSPKDGESSEPDADNDGSIERDEDAGRATHA